MILGKEKAKVMTEAALRYTKQFQIEHLLKKNPMVTHDPQMASHCKKIILLKDGVILDTLRRKDGREEFYQEIIGRMADL